MGYHGWVRGIYGYEGYGWECYGCEALGARDMGAVSGAHGVTWVLFGRAGLGWGELHEMAWDGFWTGLAGAQLSSYHPSVMDGAGVFGVLGS